MCVQANVAYKGHKESVKNVWKNETTTHVQQAEKREKEREREYRDV